MEKKYIINKIALVLLCVLLVGMVVMNVIMFFAGKTEPSELVIQIISIAIDLAIMYYALFAYKKPHGNELKFIILFCAAFMMFKTIYIGGVTTEEGKLNYVKMIDLTSILLATLLMAYVSGRLDRIKENKIIFLVALGLVAVSTACLVIRIQAGEPIGEMPGGEAPDQAFGFAGKILRFDVFVQLAALMMAYLSRYALHKEAGLKDK